MIVATKFWKAHALALGADIRQMFAQLQLILENQRDWVHLANFSENKLKLIKTHPENVKNI